MQLRAIAWGTNPQVYEILAEHQYLQKFFAQLPCPECQVHARKYYDTNPPSFCSSDTYQAWVFDFHNSVNKRLGKAEFTWAAYEEHYREERLGRK